MNPITVWAIGIGASIFGLGMISAIASKKQQRSSSKISRKYTAMSQASNEAQPLNDKKARPSAADMASRGVANGEENLASIGGNPR